LSFAAIAATTARAAPTPAPTPCAGVLLSGVSGAPVPGADTIYGESVLAVVADGHGGWFVGGEFWSVGTAPRSNLAHVDRNGRVYANWHPNADGIVEALALSGSRLYVAGLFRHVAGLARPGVAAVDTVTGRPSRWLPSARDVSEIAATRAAVYLGSQRGIVAVDPVTGASEDPPFAGVAPFAVTPLRTYLVTGGPFYGGLHAVQTSSGEPDEWDPAARGYFSSLTAAAGRVLATGRFQIGVRRRIGLAAWTSDSARLLWIANSDGFVNSASVAGNRVYLGGLFRFLGGQKRPRLGAVDLRTGRALAWTPKWNADLRWTPVAVAAGGGRVFVGAAVTSGGNAPPCSRRP